MWLIDIPSKGELNRVHGINMIPSRVIPGAPSQDVPTPLARMINAIRQNIRGKVEHYTQLEESGWVFKELKVLEILTKPEGELVVPRVGRVITLGNKYLKIPTSLTSKHCLLNIKNTDNA